ncbi:hypothetical protein RM531_08160 [Salinisphaera sp. P385]|uniref:Uncharacterized protein n=1 Tax=Spectribacter acetivorans TaxID=3075603 RepID=A0ABU3BB10_9GAMM|nr:hypothetical protein [Salinisphaera sp. P385]MDT0618448.1 hypothetical protein [Salinisphaera sp. P385]
MMDSMSQASDNRRSGFQVISGGQQARKDIEALMLAAIDPASRLADREAAADKLKPRGRLKAVR